MQPWFKFYAADYLLDDAVFEMPPEAGQLLVLTWCLCWRDGCAPADPDKLARAARLDKRYVRRHFDTVARFFRVENGTLISARMDRERAENEAKTEIATALARNAANARWSQQRPGKSGNGDARRNASRNADRNACQSQSQNQIEKKSPSDSCAEPRSGAVSAPSPDCPEFPTKGPVRTWQATADQVARWRELYSGLDVRHELQKAHAWVLANPGRAKTARGMAGFVLNWLTRATDRPRGSAANRGNEQLVSGLSPDQILAEMQRIRDRVPPSRGLNDDERRRMDRLRAEFQRRAPSTGEIA